MLPADSRASDLFSVRNRIPLLYLLVAVPITLLLCFLTAPFFAPDEVNHSCRAISLGHGVLLAQTGVTGPNTSEPGADIDGGALRVMSAMDEIRMAWEKRNSAIPNSNFRDRFYGPVPEAQQLALAHLRWTHQQAFAGFANTAVYPPWFYLPAILSWRLAEAANLTIFESLHLVRVTNCLIAVFLSWLALRLCACSGWMLLPFLLLPSTLFLYASCSQDALSLPSIALFAALLSRPLADRRSYTTPELIASSILIAACATARPPYAALAVLLLLPTLEVDGMHREWRPWIRPAAAFTFVLAVCALWRHLAAPLGLDSADEADPDLQRVFLQHHPFAGAVALLRGTAEAAFDFFHRGLYVIGWNDLLPHHLAAPAITLCLVLMILFGPAFPLRTWPGRVLLALAIAAPLLGISLAEYLIWTPPGHATVYGIQPRYWLPVLPFAAMLAQGRIPTSAWPRLLLSATTALAAIACTLPMMAAHAFYQDTFLHVLELNLR